MIINNKKEAIRNPKGYHFWSEAMRKNRKRVLAAVQRDNSQIKKVGEDLNGKQIF